MDQKHKVITMHVRGRRVRLMEHYDTYARVWWGYALNLPGLIVGLRRGRSRRALRKEALQVAAAFIDTKVPA